jgi:hypothetical protein
MIEISYQSQQKPPPSVVGNVLELLDLQNSNKLDLIVNTPLKKYLVTKKQSFFASGWRFLWAARKLTYLKSNN